MKKKLLVALIAITFMLCGAFAFTACEDNKQPAETNVGLTAEELKQAIQATLNATNGKMIETLQEPGGTPQSITFLYDYEQETAKYEMTDSSAYLVKGKDSVWICEMQSSGCYDDLYSNSVKEFVTSSNSVGFCRFKPKGDDSAQFVLIEECCASFKYDSVTDTYSATLLARANREERIMEVNISLTVVSGYATKFELKWDGGFETITYSDFGTVEITVPDGVMQLVREKEQSN